MGKGKDMRYLCYPYMREVQTTVDFEIQSDALAVRIGQAASLVVPLEELHSDLLKLVEMVYHLNGSVRGKMAISSADLHKLSSLYDRYVKETEESIKQFVLPQGSAAACALHVCRSEAKKTVRALHRVSLEREVPERLFDYAHLLANVLFVMAVYANKRQGIEEIPFVSKSYPVKTRKKEIN